MPVNNTMRHIFTNNAVRLGLLMAVLFASAMLGSSYISQQRQEALDNYKATCEFIVDYEGRDAYYRCPSD